MLQRVSITAVLAVMAFSFGISAAINFIVPDGAQAITTFKYTDSSDQAIIGPYVGTSTDGQNTTLTYRNSASNQNLYIAAFKQTDVASGCNTGFISVGYPGASTGSYYQGNNGCGKESQKTSINIQGGSPQTSYYATLDTSGHPASQTDAAHAVFCDAYANSVTGSSLSHSQISDLCVQGFLAALKSGASKPPVSAAAAARCVTSGSSSINQTCNAWLTKQGYCYSLYPANNNGQATYCQIGYDNAYGVRSQFVNLPVDLTDAQKKAAADAAAQAAAASAACTPQIPGGSNQAQLLQDCVNGYVAALNSKTQDQACPAVATPVDQQYCVTGFNLGQAALAATTADKNLTCETKFDNPLTWVICPVVDAMVGAISVIDGMITDQLNIKTNAIFCSSGPTCSAYYLAWQSFRNIALGLITVAGLVVVIAQALGLEILDAYTIRKTLPRVLIAAVAITLSWPLMKFLIQLSDDVGFGVRHLIYAPFSGLSDSLDLSFGGGAANAFFGGLSFTGTVAGGGILAVQLAGGIGALLAYAGTALLAVFVAIVVLILRQVAVILLMLVAPIALVAYVLPNTQRIYRLWWESFSKALLMFPLIAAFIATGRVFSAIAIHNGTALNQLIGFAAYFAPYFMIPLTFRLAGSSVGALGNFVNGRAQGGFDTLRKRRAEQRKHKREALATGHGLHEDITTLGYNRFAKRYNQLTAGAANVRNAGYNPGSMKSRMQAAATQRDLALAQEGIEKNPEAKSMTDDLYESMFETTESSPGSGIYGGNDDATRRAFLADRGFKGRDLTEGVATVRAFARSFGNERAAKIGAVIGNSRTGTGWKADVGGAAAMNAAIIESSGGSRWLMDQTLVAARTGMGQERRYDAMGGSYTQHEELLMDQALHGKNRDLARDPRYRANVNEQLILNALEGQSGGALLSGRRQSQEATFPVMRQVLDRSFARANHAHQGVEIARATGNTQAVAAAETEARESDREVMQQLAATFARHDVSGQVSTESGKLYADAVLSEPVNIRDLPVAVTQVAANFLRGLPENQQTITVGELRDAVDNDVEYREMHREYHKRLSDEAAAAQQAAAQQGAQQQAGVPPNPAGP